MAPVQRKGLRALQIWCSQVTAEYPNVNITDLSTSFRDGLAFNAIIHHFRPDLFDYKSLNPHNVMENNAHAFRIAENELNIPALLDPEDMVDCEEPDKFSVATYLAQFYHLFKSASPPVTPTSRTSLTRLSSSEGENDSLLSTSSTESPPATRSTAPNFNRSELIAKYGEDIFSCSSPTASDPPSTSMITSTPKLRIPATSQRLVPLQQQQQQQQQKKNETSAVASVRKQFEQFAKISAS